MLAVTMLGLLVLAVSSTWTAGLRGWKRSNRLAENYQRQRVLLDALTELTQAAVFVSERKRLYAFHPERDPLLGDTISFVTSSDALLPPQETIVGGLRRVTIGLNNDHRGEPCLTMLNAPALQEVDRLNRRPGHVLARDVTAFSLRYRDFSTGVWKDRWTEQDGVPSAIEFNITFAPLEPRGTPFAVTRVVDLPAAKLARQPPMTPAP
jgi:hypothetical protein